LGRIGWIIASFVAALGLGTAGLVATSWSISVEAGRDLTKYRRIVEHLVERKNPRAPLLVWLGDSTMVSRRGITGYPARIARRLHGPVETRNLFIPALDPYHYYFLMGPIVEHGADVVVIALHLRLFRPETHFKRNDLASYLPTAELARAAALPLHERGLTLPKLLLYRSLRFGSVERLYQFAVGQRQRFHDSRRWAWLGKHLRVPSRDGVLDLVRRYDDDIYPGHPMVRIVGAGVELATRGGARVLAVVSPIPIDVLRDHGLYDGDRYADRIRGLAAVVEAGGGELIDLHALLSRDEFSDSLGHMTRDGTAHMVEALLPSVEALVEEARARRTQPGER